MNIRMPRIMTTESFILRATGIHRDKESNPLYLYAKSKFTKSAEKTTITCRVHGDFEQSPNNHLSGHGCKKCANAIIAKKQTTTQAEFIRKCEEKHPAKLDYSKTIYVNQETPAIFICKKCTTEFTRDPAHMLGEGRGHGCVVCNGGVKDNLSTFITKAKLTHGDKFKYHLVEYVNSLTKVKIECDKGHIFEQTPNHHVGGDGCRKCRGYYKTQEDFEAESIEMFPLMFDYSKTKFIDMSTPVILICSRNHEFTTVPTIHFREGSKGGCMDCAHIETSLRNLYTQSQWIELAIKQHGDTYLYHKVEYTNSQTGVCVVCRKHGPFQVTPACHLGGTGCRKCGIERSAAAKLYTEADIEEAITNARILHNSRYKYIRVFRDEGRLMIEMHCPAHEIITQRLDHHLNGHGCDRCVPKYSKQQIEWLNYCSIRRPGIRHAENSGEYRIPGTSYKADGFDDTDTNTVYEYQGDFWHGNPAVFNPLDINPRTNTTYGFLYERTQKKIAEIKSRGYRVIEVWEKEWVAGKRAVVEIQKKWKLLSYKV